MKEFLKKLGITLPGVYTEDDTFVIDIEDSDEFGKIFTKLDKSDLVDEDGEQNILTLTDSMQVFYADDFQLSLIGDMKNDTYKLVIKEL